MTVPPEFTESGENIYFQQRLLLLISTPFHSIQLPQDMTG
jgi:hypothetical protein